jgi:hypothetical protein
MKKDKKFNYVYITTNLINGKQYIGDHSTNKKDDNYIGSGKYLLYALDKYGIENFERKILEFFDTKENAFNAQEKYINEYNTLVPNGYNISPKGGHQCKNSVSESTKKLLRISAKKQFYSLEYRIAHGEITKLKMNNPVIKKKQIEARKKRAPHSKETRKKMSKTRTGKKHSEETKEKMRNSHLGKKYKTFSKKDI